MEHIVHIYWIHVFIYYSACQNSEFVNGVNFEEKVIGDNFSLNIYLTKKSVVSESLGSDSDGNISSIIVIKSSKTKESINDNNASIEDTRGVYDKDKLESSDLKKDKIDIYITTTPIDEQSRKLDDILTEKGSVEDKIEENNLIVLNNLEWDIIPKNSDGVQHKINSSFNIRVLKESDELELLVSDVDINEPNTKEGFIVKDLINVDSNIYMKHKLDNEQNGTELAGITQEKVYEKEREAYKKYSSVGTLSSKEPDQSHSEVSVEITNNRNVEGNTHKNIELNTKHEEENIHSEETQEQYEMPFLLDLNLGDSGESKCQNNTTENQLNLLNAKQNPIHQYLENSKHQKIWVDSQYPKGSIETIENQNKVRYQSYFNKENQEIKTLRQQYIFQRVPYIHRYDPYFLSRSFGGWPSVKNSPQVNLKSSRSLRQFPQSVAGSSLYGSYAMANVGYPSNVGSQFGGSPLVGEPIIGGSLNEEPLVQEPLVQGALVEETGMQQPVVEESSIHETVEEETVIEEPVA